MSAVATPPSTDPACALHAGCGVVDLGGGASASWLGGQRLFLQHGPINLVIRADGAPDAVADGYRALLNAFPRWLSELVAELPVVRRPLQQRSDPPRGAIARRMHAAVLPHRAGFITCMAAVAGAVADEAAAVLAGIPGIHRAYVNNGGDISLHLTPGSRLHVGVVPRLHDALGHGRLEVDAASPVRGIATSGWDGRSHSLGIADAVCVLARDAASADAAATVIANAVDIDHPGIVRAPAHTLDDESDLGARLVTVQVPALPAELVAGALDAGLARASNLRARGVIVGAALSLQGRWRLLGLAAPGAA